ncbi:MAG: hypothetical protein U9Q33_13500 [Campylobacterota bacterium]|nr:hypothetical protein [Campylobacterota bacterium]
MEKDNNKKTEHKIDENFIEIKCLICPKCDEYIAIYVNELGIPIKPAICSSCGNEITLKDLPS